MDFFFYLLRLRRYKAKRVKTRCYQEGVGHLEPRCRGRGRPWGIFFGFYKTRHILLSNSSNCAMLRAIVLTQYQRVTDGRTDRWTETELIASTALAIRPLLRAVKNEETDKGIQSMVHSKANLQCRQVLYSTPVIRGVNGYPGVRVPVEQRVPGQ